MCNSACKDQDNATKSKNTIFSVHAINVEYYQSKMLGMLSDKTGNGYKHQYLRNSTTAEEASVDRLSQKHKEYERQHGKNRYVSTKEEDHTKSDGLHYTDPESWRARVLCSHVVQQDHYFT